VLFQLGAVTPRNSALCALLGSLLQVPFFEQLRTKEQLGYLVSAGAATLGCGSILALRFTVQSSLASCAHIEGRIKAFLEGFPGVLAGWGEEGVRERAAVLAARVREPSKTPGEDFGGVWGGVAGGTLEWGACDARAAALEGATLGEVVDVWGRCVAEGGAGRRRVVARVHAAAVAAAAAAAPQQQQEGGASASGGEGGAAAAGGAGVAGAAGAAVLLGGGPSARPADPPPTAVHITGEREGLAFKARAWAQCQQQVGQGQGQGQGQGEVAWLPGRGTLAFLTGGGGAPSGPK
jgi:hypothetical protein